MTIKKISTLLSVIVISAVSSLSFIPSVPASAGATYNIGAFVTTKVNLNLRNSKCEKVGVLKPAVIAGIAGTNYMECKLAGKSFTMVPVQTDSVKGTVYAAFDFIYTTGNPPTPSTATGKSPFYVVKSPVNFRTKACARISTLAKGTIVNDALLTPQSTFINCNIGGSIYTMIHVSYKGTFGYVAVNFL